MRTLDAKLAALEERRRMLAERSGQQRAGLVQTLAPYTAALGRVDGLIGGLTATGRTLRTTEATWLLLPLAVAAGSRPRWMLRWLRRGLFAWLGWRRFRSRLIELTR